ncbi:MAG: hypothetical protein QXS93_00745 [Candidatus Micrarchaeia archaeon]
MPEAVAQKRLEEEETEEKREKKRRAREKAFDQKRDLPVPELKIETPKVEQSKPQEEKKSQPVEASLKTTVQERDIVIDDKGTLSKDYVGKETLNFKRTESYLEEQKREDREKKAAAVSQAIRAKEDENLKREELRERLRREERSAEEIRQAKEKERVEQDLKNIEKAHKERRVAEKEALGREEREAVTRREKVEVQRREVNEHMERSRREAEERKKDVERLKENLNRRKRNISREIEALQKILLGGPFRKSRKGIALKFVRSLDDFIKSLSSKKRK